MNTFERVRCIIVQRLDIGEEQITLETSLKDDLAADSLDLVEIVMALEEEFEVEFDDETSNLTTVAQIVDYIDRQMGATA
jgi:acyl carrier protein